MERLARLLSRQSPISPAGPTQTEFDAARSERDGYKNAYEVVATELGMLRMTAAPYVRPHNQRIPAGPSIFVVTLAKSGTVFIGQSLRQSLGYDFTSTLVTPRPFKNIVWPTMAHDFMRGGMVSVSHMQADAVNLSDLNTAGISKIVLHVRDPRAAAHSWLHFLEQIAREQNGQSRLGDIAPPIDLSSITRPMAERVDEVIDTFLAGAVRWLGEWADAMQSRPEFEILLMQQDQLRDPSSYFRQVTQFCGTDREITPVGKSSETHFRTGDNNDWRSTFTAEQRDRATSMIPEQLWSTYKWRP